MKLTISNKILLQGIPQSLEMEITQRLTFQNPKFLENEKRGRWNGDTPKYLSCYEHTRDGLIIPRGYARQLIGICKQFGIQFDIDDQRRILLGVDIEFRGTLRPFQEKAVKDVLSRDFGTLSSPTGSGKTCMALYCIAERKQPALIVVHTRELLEQWINRIHTFLDIPVNEIGVIGGGKKRVGEKITVATVQTLYKCAEEISLHIGFLIVDEAHRCPSRIFTEAVTGFDSKYMLGLSATPFRRDGLSRLIYWHLGDVVHEVKKDDLLQTGDIVPAEVVIRETNFRTWLDPSEEYSTMLTELTRDPERNQLIARDIAAEAKNGGRISLVLSDRKAHCDTLRVLLGVCNVPCEVLTGDIANGKRQAIIDRVNRGKVKVLIATGQLIGEGFDCKQLSTLFLATPIRFDGRVIQYLGRVLRAAPGKKKAKIYDYVDIHIGPLKASANARQRVFQTVG